MTDQNLRNLQRAASTDPEAAEALAVAVARAGLTDPARDHAAAERATLAALREIDMHEDLERLADPRRVENGARVDGRLVGYNDGVDRWVVWGTDYVAAVKELAGATGGEGASYEALIDGLLPVLWSQIGSATYTDARAMIEGEGLTAYEVEGMVGFVGWELEAPEAPEGAGLEADADGEWVDDLDGGTWYPSDEAALEIAESDDREETALRICRDQPMRGEWRS